MYYADLTWYTRWHQKASDKLLNVGWLDRAHPFQTETPHESTLSTLLWHCCEQGVMRTRGWHFCDVCQTPRAEQFALGSDGKGYGSGFLVQHNGRGFRLGDAEIRVRGENGIVYAAPNLVYHYVRDHHYKPPGDFLNALRRSSSSDQQPTTKGQQLTR